MRIVICAATAAEIEPLMAHSHNLLPEKPENLNLFYVIHGVGLLSAAVSLTGICLQMKPDLIVQAGIAGSFDQQYPIGSAVLVKDEQLGDMGVYEANGWKDLFDSGLKKESSDAYTHRKLVNRRINDFALLKLPAVSAVTVNQISTGINHIDMLRRKYQVQIESMEGAALHYTCLKHHIPFLQVRSISNTVGERNKQYWNIPLAIEQLNTTLLTLLQHYYKLYQ